VSENTFYGVWFACLAAGSIFASQRMVSMLELLFAGVLFWLLFMGLQFFSMSKSFTREFHSRMAAEEQVRKYQAKFGRLPEDEAAVKKAMFG